MYKLTLIVCLLFCSLTHVEADTNVSNELPEEYYYKLGLPILEKSWSADDYKDALKVLKYISETEPHHLPSATSPILKKIADIDSSFIVTSPYLDDLNRKILLLQMGESIPYFLLLYISQGSDSLNKLKYSEECIMLMKSTLDLTRNILLSFDEFLVNDKGLTEEQLAGKNQMKLGLNNVVSGCITTLQSDYTVFEEDDICILGKHFYTFYSITEKYLDQNARNEFSRKIKSIQTSHPYDCLH